MDLGKWKEEAPEVPGTRMAADVTDFMGQAGRYG